MFAPIETGKNPNQYVHRPVAAKLAGLLETEQSSEPSNIACDRAELAPVQTNAAAASPIPSMRIIVALPKVSEA
jgi:hypothetical protein